MAEEKQSTNWGKKLKLEFDRLNGKYTKGREKFKVSNIVPSKRDRELIHEFIDDCKAERLSLPRMTHYVQVLRLSKRFLNKDFEKMTKQSMQKLIGNVESSNLKEWTKQGYRIAMKKFFRWLENKTIEQYNKKNPENKKPLLKDKEYPESVEWINTTMKNSKTRLPEEILTEDDIKLIVEHCNHIRDKALIMLLWDSGCRIGEILNLRLKHLVFDKYGAQIIVNGKTGGRRVRLIPSVPYLSNWKENHPDKDNNEAYLFVNYAKFRGERITYAGVDSLLRRLKKNSGIKKRINAHSFRHARATFFASRVKEAVMKEMFGWTQKSQMVGTYIHLSGRDVDREVLKAQGIVQKEGEEESKLKPIKCPICERENPATAKFCQRCGKPIAKETIIEYEREITFASKIQSKLSKKITQTEKIDPNITLQEYLKNLTKEIIKEELLKKEI